MGNGWAAGLSPEHHSIKGVRATKWAYGTDLPHAPSASARGSRRTWVGWEGASALQVHTSLPLPHLCLYAPQPLRAGATGRSHQQARPVLLPIPTKTGNGCGASACHWQEAGLELGLMFSITTDRASVKPQRLRCYHPSKLIVSHVSQMWDPEAEARLTGFWGPFSCSPVSFA